MDELFPTKWRIIALVLAAVAIGALCFSLKIAGEAKMSMAAAVAERDLSKSESARFLAYQSDKFRSAGLILGVVAIICWGVSRWNGEPGREGVVFALVSVWLVLFLVMI